MAWVLRRKFGVRSLARSVRVMEIDSFQQENKYEWSLDVCMNMTLTCAKLVRIDEQTGREGEGGVKSCMHACFSIVVLKSQSKQKVDSGSLHYTILHY